MAFIPVHLNTLREDEIISFDLHLKLSDDGEHFVHYIKKDETLELTRIRKLKEKGIKKVFIVHTDEELYLDYLDKGLEQKISGDSNISDKAAMVHDTLHTQADNAERALETEKNYSRMEGQLGKIVSFFNSERGALKSLLNASNVATTNSEHSANVASLALGIATLAGVTNAQDLLDLGIACLVHDIGAAKLGLDPKASKDTLSGRELDRYLSHTQEGVAVLSEKKFISPRVLLLVADHEEMGLEVGCGYPGKKRIDKLSPISQILNLANAFDKFCVLKNLNPKEAIDSFFEAYSEKFNFNHLTILASVVTAR